MKAGIFGGTFDPVHNGHMIVADAVYQNSDVEEIVLIPSYISPHKQYKSITDPLHRMNMLDLAVTDRDFLKVSSMEINRKGTSFTFTTMQELLRTFPENEYYFIIGADMVFDLPNWYRVKDLTAMCRFIAMKRPGYQNDRMDRQIDMLEKEYSAGIDFVEVPQVDISSTAIREKIRKGESVSGAVPPCVELYIKEHALYKAE